LRVLLPNLLPTFMSPKTSVAKCLVRGQSLWRVRWTELGRVRRKFFTGRPAAEAHAASVRGEALNARQQFLALNPAEQQNIMFVWNDAKSRNVDLFTALSRAEAFAVAAPGISTVINEMLTVKRKSGLSDRYLVVLEMILNQFAKGMEHRPVSAVALADVEKYLDSHNAVSRQCLRGRVSTLLRFAVRRGYRTDNPCERLEPMKLPHKTPTIFTLQQVESALTWLKKNPRSLAWFILSTFAGLRPEEADATKWEDIHFAEKWIRIEAQTSKLRQRRIVYPLPMVFDWLKLAKKRKSSLPLIRSTRFLDLRELRAPLCIAKWPKDVTRHSAASYWLAACGSAATVATALGHSESVMRKNYMALVTKADAEKFWAISPDSPAPSSSSRRPRAARLSRPDTAISSRAA